MNELSWALVGLFVLTLILHLVAWLVRLPLASRLLGGLPWLPVHCGLPVAGAENVELLTSDGVRLRASYLAGTAAERRGAVVFCHELNSDRWSASVATEELRRRGLDVLTFDFRNHGTSQYVAGYDPAPWATRHELADVRAAIDYLCARPDADPRGIGLMGIGRGASVALCAAAADPRIRAVVADSPLPPERIQAARLRRIAGQCLGPLHRLVPQIVLEAIAASARMTWGWPGSGALGVDEAAARLQCPVLLVHGNLDAYVTPAAMAGLRQRIAGAAKLWSVAEAGYARALCMRPTAYGRRVARYFFRRLSRHVAHEAAHPARRPTVKVAVALTAHRNGHAPTLPRRAK